MNKLFDARHALHAAWFGDDAGKFLAHTGKYGMDVGFSVARIRFLCVSALAVTAAAGIADHQARFQLKAFRVLACRQRQRLREGELACAVRVLRNGGQRRHHGLAGGKIVKPGNRDIHAYAKPAAFTDSTARLGHVVVGEGNRLQPRMLLQQCGNLFIHKPRKVSVHHHAFIQRQPVLTHDVAVGPLALFGFRMLFGAGHIGDTPVMVLGDQMLNALGEDGVVVDRNGTPAGNTAVDFPLQQNVEVNLQIA